MKIGDYNIRTDWKWSKDYEPLEVFLENFEGEIAACGESLAAQRKLFRSFVERYVALRNEIDQTAIPVADVVRACDARTAFMLWRAAAGFFGD